MPPGRRRRRVPAAPGCGNHRVLGIRRDPVLLETSLALENLLPECFEIYLQLLGLRQHLALFLIDVVADVFRKHRELGVAVVVGTPVVIQLGDEHPRDVMLFVRFVHEVLADMLADGRIEDVFLDDGVDLQRDACLRGVAPVTRRWPMDRPGLDRGR